MVKAECAHCNGESTMIEMTGHAIRSGGESLMPGRRGNRWQYQWRDSGARVFMREFYRMGHRMDGAKRLGQAVYGYDLAGVEQALPPEATVR